jgi:drug/metabolite transporter (DMT)-like permease
LKILLVWILTCAIWSTVWLFIKLGVTDMPPVTFAAYRLLTAFLILAPITLARRVPLPRNPRDWTLIAGTGVLLLGANYAVLYWGLQYVSSGLTAVLQALTPAFGMVFAHLLLPDERITPGKFAALTLGVVGVGIIFADQLQFAGWRSLWGSVAVLSGAVFVAFAYVVMKKRGRHLHPSVITTGQMLSAFVPLSIFAILVEGNPLAVRWTSTALASLLYLSVLGSVIATWLNYWLLQRMEATKVLLMGLAEPPLAMLLGAAFLDETLSVRALAGTTCILVSVALVLELLPAGRMLSLRPVRVADRERKHGRSSDGQQ